MTPIESLAEAFTGPAWHGPSLRSSLRGVTDELASWRPAAGRHNIWEIVVHAAYWKHIVRQRLTGGRDRFPLRGRNWFARPGGGRSWSDDRALLDAEHQRLLAAVARLDRRDLGRTVHAGQSAEANIRGIAAHDVYHAAQVQLIKALAGGLATRR